MSVYLGQHPLPAACGAPGLREEPEGHDLGGTGVAGEGEGGDLPPGKPHPRLPSRQALHGQEAVLQPPLLHHLNRREERGSGGGGHLGQVRRHFLVDGGGHREVAPLWAQAKVKLGTNQKVTLNWAA